MKLLLITKRESDISKIFRSLADVVMVSPYETDLPKFEDFDGMAILGGTDDNALILNGYLREKCEAFSETGKPIFLEYVNSFACVYSASRVSVTPHRLVACDDLNDDITKGSLLDSRCNSYIRPHFLMPETIPLLYYKQFTPAHDRLKDISGDDFEKDIALFKSKNLLFAAFRMCDYVKAGFSPKRRWNSLMRYICEFLGIPTSVEPLISGDAVAKTTGDFHADLDVAITNALELLKEYLVLKDGSLGIKEGLSHNILSDGKRILNENVRADCSGEAAGAFLFAFEDDLKKIADNIYSYCYGPMVEKNGEFKGMMRWTEEAWNVCYQDDVARAIIPSLLCAYFGLSDKYVKDAANVLEFLCRTTCKDGLRPARTDVLEYIKSGESVNTVSEIENGYACAHYNSWYSAALLLGYEACGNEEFLRVGIQGIETLMNIYPNTIREHSETSEQCRLIFPLAVLYGITGEKRHYEMLEKVYDDLQKRKHSSGGFAEWDTGYKAVCFNQANGECSLLSENGDPVSDMLYSINWLPLGFAFAYLVTGEERFKSAWEDICAFFIKTQISSDNKLTNGGWCRGIDLETLEYCGVPHDVGWGPCSMETGWTVAEITMGMEIGKEIISGKLKRK